MVALVSFKNRRSWKGDFSFLVKPQSAPFTSPIQVVEVYGTWVEPALRVILPPASISRGVSFSPPAELLSLPKTVEYLRFRGNEQRHFWGYTMREPEISSP